MRFSSDDIEILQAFLEEAPDHLKGLEERILKLESEPSAENIDNLFRTFHSLKGMAGFANLTSVVNVCHELEDILKSLKNDQISFATEIVDLLLEGADFLNFVVQRLMEALENYNGEDIEVEVENLGEQEILIKVSDFRKTHAENSTTSTSMSEESMPKSVDVSQEKIEQVSSNDGIELSDFVKDFIEELKDKLEEIEEKLLEFEKRQDKDVSNELMRLFHSIKGDSRLILSMSPEEKLQKSLIAIENISHGIEELFQKIMNNQLRVSTDIVDLVFAGMDLTKSLLNSLIESKDPPETENYIKKLRNNASLGEDEVSLTSIESSKKSEDETIAFKAFENITSQWFEFLEMFLKSPSENGFKQLIRMTENVKNGLLHLKENDKLSIIDRLIKTIEEEKYDETEDLIKSFENWLKEKKKVIESKRIESKSVSTKQTSKNITLGSEVTSKTIRIDKEKLDKLMNLVGELITLKNSFTSMIREPHNIQNTKDYIGKMERLANEFQSTVMSMRMIPVSELFNRYKRTIRDLSKNLRKSVELFIEGEETELDRTVIEQLADPLTHLIRNAVDHGIEEPDKRVKQGKPKTGSVYLRAYYKGSYVFIEVEDDGQGIDPNAVRARIIERGILTPDQAIEIPDDEIISFIFEPGFSTKKEVSNISGRGVGMDVVKTNIEKMGGKVFVESKLNMGTKITMRIPLSLSIVLGLMFEVNEQKYIFPIEYIRETIKVRKEKIHDYGGVFLVDVRDKMIPLITIEETLHQKSINPMKKEYDFNLIPLIIVEEGTDVVAFAVDRFLEESEFLIKPVPEYLRVDGLVSGATILGNGEVVLIIDPTRLVK
ncbi:MAG TPA: chemotaxis protein CheA [Thermotogaceae bacterium]|nr:chemotaxis protein CheA [Thermotogaceae bacterium]